MKLLKNFGINSTGDLLDLSILLILGASFLLYSIFYKTFAEVHINLPFLNFPVFIGEIILFICALLVFSKYLITKKQASRFHLIFGAYLLFILFKAIAGYIKFGPLAFRHAAMFYYPVFALISYEAYQPRLIKTNLLFVLFIVLAFFGIGTYYNFTYLILMIIFLIYSKSTILRVIGLTIMLCFFQFNSLVFCCRTQLIGHIFGFSLILILLILAIRIKFRYKILLGFVSAAVFAMAIFSSKDDSRIASLISPKKFISIFNSWDARLQKEKNNFKPQEIPPRLYNPEKTQDMPQLRVVKEAEKIVENISKEIPPRLYNPEKTQDMPQLRVVKEAEKIMESKGVQEKKITKKIEITYNPAERKELSNFLKSKNIELHPQTNTLLYNERLPGKKDITATIDLPKDRRIKNEVVAFLQERRMVGSELVNDPEIDLGIETRFGTAIFRLFVWRDMLRDILKYKPLFGFDLGRPFRSKSIEITGMAYGEWARDGWISAHNSYLEVIYRSGIIGIALFILLFAYLAREVRRFIKNKVFLGILLMGIIFYWLATAITYVTFELPYSAIFFWIIVGITFAYSHNYLLTKDK